MVYFVELLASFLAVMIVITLHEFGHAFVAYKCGDPTAKFSGRMTLNPFKHFDPLGIIMFAFVGFGWAKPVPVNPNNFRNYRKGSFLTSFAGIFINYVSAFLFFPIYLLVCKYLLPHIPANTYGYYFIHYLFLYIYIYSLNFAVFNLLPFYPLDGFRIVDALNKKRGKVYRFLRNYGYFILLGLMVISFLANRFGGIFVYINILDIVLGFFRNILAIPIKLIWSFI